MKPNPDEMQVAELVALGKIEVRTAPIPTVGEGELLLATRAVGLCATDVKAFRRGHPYFRPPCILGHELVGVVREVGAGVDAFTVGDRVVCAPYVECGGCPACRRGVGELCEHKAFVSGALQEYVLLPSEVVRQGTFLVPPEISDGVATLAEPLACAWNGIERAGVREGDTVLIVGGGPMGALLALLAKAITPHVLVSEISAPRTAQLRRLGLAVADPAEKPIEEALASAFGVPTAHRVLVAVGARDVAEASIARTAPGGTFLLFGGLPKGERLAVDAFAVHYLEVSIVGSFGFRLEHFRDAVAWMARHPHALDGVVTASVPFRDAAAAFARAGEPGALKTVIRFDDAR